MDKIDVTTDVL